MILIQIIILDIILIMQYDIIFGRNNVCWGFTNNWDCNMYYFMNLISRITTKMVPETTSMMQPEKILLLLMKEHGITFFAARV